MSLLKTTKDAKSSRSRSDHHQKSAPSNTISLPPPSIDLESLYTEVLDKELDFNYHKSLNFVSKTFYLHGNFNLRVIINKLSYSY